MSKFWRVVSTTVAFYPALGAGAVHGVYNKLTGNGTFTDGINETGTKVMDAAGDFADKYGDDLTREAIKTGGKIIGSLITGE